MEKDAFLKLGDPEKLEFMKKHLDHLSHDFQHQEIVEILSFKSESDEVLITVWEKGVNAENWPEFTDYFHHQVKYRFRSGHFEFVEE